MVAVSDALDAAKHADIIVFVVPHQFVDNLCKSLAGRIRPNAIGISLIKGFDIKTGGGIELISHIISTKLLIPCHVLMGANIAGEVAAEKFVCTSTLGCKYKARGSFLKDLFNTPHLKITVVADEDTVEVCGALKNIVATGVGFIDGLEENNRYKEAVLRLGFMEMVQFVDVFFPGGNISTFFESCGIEDLIVTSFAGRNRKCSAAFVKTGKTFKELENEMLNGQKLQGPPTAVEVAYMLNSKDMTNKFPLFTVIHQICTGKKPAKALLKCVDDNIARRVYLPKNLIP
ncbi:hypothetical protein HHI36_012437 [Cryptolaemus montrouzieri]|uniref:Glycerol-3-phosphate dehydrogenase [NAD(+)] n=1 Tax=Cryptolaemus montrouzieri TaxID=559131 RepID=A0ABD2NEQ0_9CUCU